MHTLYCSCFFACAFNQTKSNKLFHKPSYCNFCNYTASSIFAVAAIEKTNGRHYLLLPLAFGNAETVPNKRLSFNRQLVLLACVLYLARKWHPIWSQWNACICKFRISRWRWRHLGFMTDERDHNTHLECCDLEYGWTLWLILILNDTSIDPWTLIVDYDLLM